MHLLDVNTARNFFLWPNETLCEEMVTSKNSCELLAVRMGSQTSAPQSRWKEQETEGNRNERLGFVVFLLIHK